jgi:hypothetical protein
MMRAECRSVRSDRDDKDSNRRSYGRESSGSDDAHVTNHEPKDAKPANKDAASAITYIGPRYVSSPRQPKEVGFKVVIPARTGFVSVTPLVS